jgi:hypothetical protein
MKCLSVRFEARVKQRVYLHQWPSEQEHKHRLNQHSTGHLIQHHLPHRRQVQVAGLHQLQNMMSRAAKRTAILLTNSRCVVKNSHLQRAHWGSNHDVDGALKVYHVEHVAGYGHSEDEQSNNNNEIIEGVCFAVNKIVGVNLQRDGLLTRGGTNNAPATMS